MSLPVIDRSGFKALVAWYSQTRARWPELSRAKGNSASGTCHAAFSERSRSNSELHKTPLEIDEWRSAVAALCCVTCAAHG
jgi:hypothetical protein